MAGNDPDPDITGLIKLWQEGKEDALEDLFPRIYHPLRIVARRAMQSERADHTLQPTALVHEAFMKLTESTSLELQDRQHFFAFGRYHDAPNPGGPRAQRLGRATRWRLL